MGVVGHKVVALKAVLIMVTVCQVTGYWLLCAKKLSGRMKGMGTIFRILVLLKVCNYTKGLGLI